MRSMREKQRSKKTLKTFLKTPKGYVLMVLLVLTVIACFHPGSKTGLINVLISVGSALLFDYLIAIWKKREKRFSDGAIITGLIVAIVLSPAVPSYIVVLITIIALASKHLFKYKRKPIFNPAAFGLMFAALVFSAGESWWGALSLLPAWNIVCLLIGGYLVTYRVNKFPQIFAFLGAYVVLFTILGFLHISYAGDALRIPFINAALFLAFFMLTDPPTSPAKDRDQIIFGILTAVLGTAVYVLFGGLTYLLVGLLVANAWKAWRTKRQEKYREAKRVNRFYRQATP